MAGKTEALRILTLALLLALAACGDGGKLPFRRAAAEAPAPVRALEGELAVIAVAGATPPGLFREFEQASACTIAVHTAAGPAQLLELAAQGDADLVLATGDNAASLVAAGDVRVLDAKQLPALARLPLRLRDVRGALVDGRRYGLPWRWQANVLAYDSKAHALPPQSWKILFEPEVASETAPSLLASPEPVAIADAAIYLAVAQPELRITDPHALDERQYAAALALLKRQHAAWRGAWRDVAAQAEGFRNGVAASQSTPAAVRALQSEGLPVAWTLPLEGGSAQVEIAMLHAQARHPNCALAWMQWASTPRAQARLAAAAGALPVLPAACALEPLASADACVRDGMALLPRLHPHVVPQADCGQRRCVPYSRWTRDYLALLGE